MIKLKYKTDLERLNNNPKIPNVLKKYVSDYFREMLSRFKGDNLNNLGSIFVLDSKEAVIASELDDFIDKYPPYRTAGITLYDNNTPVYITHILLFINNGYAVNIFVEEQYVKDILSDYYKSEVS